MRAALLLVSFATLPLAACFGDEGGVVDATLTVTPPPTVAAASTAAATTTPQTPTATTTPEPTTTPSATPPIEGGAVCVNDPDRSSTVPGLLVDGEAFAEECCDKQTEVEHRRASRGSPILCYLRTDLHGSSFAVPRVRPDDAVEPAAVLQHRSLAATALPSTPAVGATMSLKRIVSVTSVARGQRLRRFSSLKGCPHDTMISGARSRPSRGCGAQVGDGPASQAASLLHRCPRCPVPATRRVPLDRSRPPV